jgi:Protein of unknown function (DUF3500)
MHIPTSTAAARRTMDLASDTALRMAEAAQTFLASLRPDQRTKVLFPMDSPERLNWDYRPRRRQGLPVLEMDSSQQRLAFALLLSGLGRQGRAKAMNIMALETILGEMEGSGGRHRRDPDLYFLTVFGEPSDRMPWGWRFEGHHLSLNYLVTDGKHISPTPNFFGANPARVPEGRMAGLRVLAPEEDLARTLLKSLAPAQQSRVIIAPEAPPDIITGSEPRVKLDAPSGIPFSELTDVQQGFLTELVFEYVARTPEDVADMRMNRIEKEGEKHIHFAWAGGENPGEPHYYRLHGPSFLLEYDNTQNKANHIHTVWRDLHDEWGLDLLKTHYGDAHIRM